MPTTPPRIPPRKGARTRAAIPADVLTRLERGEIPTITLVEWLAMDQVRLAASLAAGRGWARLSRRLVTAGGALAGEGVMGRMRGMGEAVAATIGSDGAAFARLSRHPSDVVRGWAAFAVQATPDLSLAERLRRLRPFAADLHAGVREFAWMAMRPAIAAELAEALRLLLAWTGSADANVRRCAIEATRPRGVWCAHLAALRRDPRPALPLLEDVRADPARYVRLSCGNWLNDAGKDHPEWVRALCRRWRREQAGADTAAIIRRALRSLGGPAAAGIDLP